MVKVAERPVLDDFFDDVPLPDELRAFMPSAPRLVTVSWIAETYDIPVSTIYVYIKDGRLPAFPAPGAKGATTYVIRPEHAFAAFGARLITRALTQDKS